MSHYTTATATATAVPPRRTRSSASS